MGNRFSKNIWYSKQKGICCDSSHRQEPLDAFLKIEFKIRFVGNRNIFMYRTRAKLAGASRFEFFMNTYGNAYYAPGIKIVILHYLDEEEIKKVSASL